MYNMSHSINNKPLGSTIVTVVELKCTDSERLVNRKACFVDCPLFDGLPICFICKIT